MATSGGKLDAQWIYPGGRVRGEGRLAPAHRLKQRRRIAEFFAPAVRGLEHVTAIEQLKFDQSGTVRQMHREHPVVSAAQPAECCGARLGAETHQRHHQRRRVQVPFERLEQARDRGLGLAEFERLRGLAAMDGCLPQFPAQLTDTWIFR